jgi:hypothetical protein
VWPVRHAAAGLRAVPQGLQGEGLLRLVKNVISLCLV